MESDDEKLSLDEKASVLRFLQKVVGAELTMVVHFPGGKSLHGWFLFLWKSADRLGV